MTFQVAPVRKPLGSASRIVKQGNRVVFDEDENGNNISNILNKRTGVEIAINDKPNGYSFDMWVKRQTAKQQGKIKENVTQVSNQYALLREEESGFQRLVQGL